MNLLVFRNFRNRSFPLAMGFFISLTISVFVYFSGGTNTVYTNFMYIPLAFISSIYGWRWGLAHAFFSGIMVGPLMPLNVTDQIMQSPLNWMFRVLIYMLISLTVGFFADIAHRREERLSYLVTHDSLTGLRNFEALRQSTIHTDDPVSMISLDIVDYEEYLGFFGYDFFQKIINAFSSELINAMHIFPNASIFRYYGLRYAIMIEHDDQEASTEKILSSLGQINDKIIQVEDVPIYLHFRVGIARLNAGERPMDGMRKSMIALRLAAHNDQKLMRFSDQLEQSYASTVLIPNTFRESLTNNAIQSAYQTIHDSVTSKPIGAELLARWIQEDGTRIPPDVFVSVLEKTELIHDLTVFMVDRAIFMLKQPTFSKYFFSVNFSATDFNEKSILTLVKHVRQSGVDSSRIHIEITERVLLSVNKIQAHLTFLHKHGFPIVIDDFGTGYSSYRYVADLPIDVIKIDRSLVLKANTDKGFGLVKSIVDFCRDFGIKTIAEGVENKEYADICEKLGIDAQQGYFYSKPEFYNPG